jgi:phenylacetate-CoA ligase
MIGEFDLLWGYQHLPIPLQDLALWLDGKRKVNRRFNVRFERFLENLLASDHWSASEIEAYQAEKLRTLISRAYDTVPYYREIMKGLKLEPRDIRSREDLHKLPILTKEEVRKHTRRLISTDAKRWNLVRHHTSGSTGSRLVFFLGRDAIPFQNAVWRRHWMRFGIDPGTWHVNFMATPVVPPAQQKPPYWRWQRPLRQAVVNIQHLTSEKIHDIVAFLDDNEFEVYTGRASVVHVFSLTGEEAGLRLTRPPRATFVGSEGLFSHQRRDIERFTGSVVSTQYGFNECCGNASHCPELVLHEDFEFGIIELIDTSPAKEEGQVQGEVVCTGFSSPEFPFIRYKVGDVAVLENPSRKCACGRESRVLTNILGRNTDYIITPEGRRIFQFDTFLGEVPAIKEFQVVQEKPGEIVLRVVRRPEYSAREEMKIRKAVQRWVSPRLTAKFEYLPEIERNENEKFTPVKSLLSTSED